MVGEGMCDPHTTGSQARASIPGRFLPSRYSRLAPPPVEMCPRADSSKPSARTAAAESPPPTTRSEEHTSELQSRGHLVCRLLLEKKKNTEQKCTRTQT